MPFFQFLKKTPTTSWSEDSLSRFPNSKLFLYDSYVMNLRDAPFSQQVMNRVHTAFKFWVQGEDISESLNRQEQGFSEKGRPEGPLPSDTGSLNLFVPESIIGAAYAMGSPVHGSELSGLEAMYGSWGLFLETAIQRKRIRRLGHFSLGCFVGHNHNGVAIERIFLPRVFISGMDSAIFMDALFGDLYSCSNEAFDKVFHNLSQYGITGRGGARSIPHSERALCLDALTLREEDFKPESEHLTLVIWNILEPCAVCRKFLMSKTCVKGSGHQKFFCLDNEGGEVFSENFAVKLSQRLNKSVEIVVKWLGNTEGIRIAEPNEDELNNAS
jgi:hypothetical protein